MFRNAKRWLTGSATLLVLFALQVSCNVHATPYGKGGYGDCKYQTCPVPPPTSTQTTLPSGLEVSVNLTEGQTIPADGYLILVTPLNGQGTSFQSVAFYIDGKLVQIVTPEATGTAQWFWNPTDFPGTQIKIIVTGTDATTVTETFIVHVAAKGTAPATQQPGGSLSKPTGIRALIEAASAKAKRAIHALPRPVVYGFPYILLVLLGLNLLLLLLQTWRELKEYHTLQQLLAQERIIAESKKTLLQLIAHYFRTPLTVLLGGLDMANVGGAPTTPLVGQLQTIAHDMQAKIERLIADLRTSGEVIATRSTASITPGAIVLWRRPGLLLPFVLIGAVLVVFNYLVQHAGGFTVTQVNLAVQLIVFAALLLATYQVFRRRQLRKRDQQGLQQIADEEMATGQQRDELIAQSVSVLADDVKRVDDLAPQFAALPSGKFVSQGQTAFHDIMTKFMVASKLHGSRSKTPYGTIQMNDMLSTAMQSLQSKATGRGISVQLQNQVELVVQEPELLAFVLQSLLDNAIAYSPDKSNVVVSTAASPSEVTITVNNPGVGIPPEKMLLLFQPFSKVEGAEVFTHEGMGFSLYLDKLILLYIGGDLTVESEPAKGTVVTMHLPYLRTA